MNKPPIFIIGCERSGTTLLRAMLDAHPHIAIPYEADRFSKLTTILNPWQHVWSKGEARAAVGTMLRHHKIRHWRIEKNAVLKRLLPVKAIRYADILRAMYETYAEKEGKHRWGDKTPANTYEIPNLAKAFPGAQFIHIVRDGRDVYLSWSKVEWAGHDLKKAAYKWRGKVWSTYRRGEKLAPSQYFQLRYEDLVRDPERILRQTCAFLNEPFSDAMLKYFQKTSLVPEKEKSFHRLLAKLPQPSRAFNWKKEMGEIDRRAFEKIAGSILLRYRYEVSPDLKNGARLRLGVQLLKDRLIPEFLRPGDQP